MRFAAVAFLTSNALLLAAGVAFAWTRTHGATVARQTLRPAVQVISFRPDELSAVGSEPTAARASGWIAFRLAPGETLLGVVGARAFPVENGAPVLGKWTDLSTAQVGARIDTKEWLQREGVPPEVFLMYDLDIRDASRNEEHRQGWARFDMTRLRTNGITIEAPARERVALDVRTAEGQAIPGALVVVDPQDICQSGLASQFALTSDDGTAVISGLSKGTSYRASLANGVGPDTRAVTVDIKEYGGRQEIRSTLPGKWEFVRHRLHFAIQGSSTRVTECKPTDIAAAGAWPVDRWVPPGRGFDAPFWIMLPASASPRAVPAHLVFSGRDGVDVPDLRVPSRLVFSPTTHDVKLVGDASRRTEPASAARDRSVPR